MHLDPLSLNHDDPCHSSKVLLSSLVHASSAVSSSLPNRAIADIETKPVPSGDSFNQLLSICFYVLDLESHTAWTRSSFLPCLSAWLAPSVSLCQLPVPAASDICIHLFDFVCICVSPLWSAQGSIMSNSYVPLPPKNSLCARRKQTEPRGWHEKTIQIAHSSTSTTSTYPFRILVRVPSACICLWLSAACVSSVSSPSSSSSDSGKSRMATKPVPVMDAKMFTNFNFTF